MKCYCHLRNIQDLLPDGKTPYERRFGMTLNGPVITFGAMVEYHPISAKGMSRLHQFGPKVLPGFSSVMYCMRVGIWKGDIMIADVEELEGDGRIRSPRQKARCKVSVNANERRKVEIPSRRWNSQNHWEKQSENTSLSPGSCWTKRGTRSFSRRIRRTLFSNPSSRWLNTRRCGSQEWFLQEISFIAVTWNQESKLHMPKEESFPIPMKYIDVTRTTHTSLDVLLEKTDWWWLERRRRKRIIRCMDRLHKIYFNEWKATWRIYMVWWETDEETNNLKTRQCMARNVEAYVWCSETESEAKVCYRETKARSCQAIAWYLLHWTRWWRIQTHHEKRS